MPKCIPSNGKTVGVASPYPFLRAQHYLYCDTSKYHYGGIFMQKGPDLPKEEMYHPILYVGSTFTHSWVYYLTLVKEDVYGIHIQKCQENDNALTFFQHQ